MRLSSFIRFGLGVEACRLHFYAGWSLPMWAWLRERPWFWLRPRGEAWCYREQGCRFIGAYVSTLGFFATLGYSTIAGRAFRIYARLR